ncbi:MULTISPECIES: pyocin activator PrtN family protein [unclassified Pseudomonas]|uniref:pyocin activator PrtN family protein n=1 Tax=unclassified Pseudomonas TaxID=196821 RepID=UPI000C88EE59|nr:MULTISPECIES: pyocin activator PrtN family protein [unclassified Pseudomonas]PMX16883.1 transcriptional regulator [Pseudomonas sp. MPBC4-3]PMX48192.1 transcriptional regulator [Pseudomonas sp. FW301-21B01]PMY08809.1 transcriptional regulator [Pseudomonas sp. MPR-R5A]PMY11529.1 transcriptional regulator [Pseudomonas sp. MPR-R2A5]PNA66644.1 transcriptional regulator [Pseudomonas sp. MPR-R5B]
MTASPQRELRLPKAPRSQTVELLYRIFGDLLVPFEQVRERYFSNLNQDNFTRALTSGRVALPITTLDTSAKRSRFIDIRHLAIFIDTQSDAADEEMANTQSHTLPRPHSNPEEN